MDDELRELIDTIKGMADQSRVRFKSTKEWTVTPGHSTETIRVPVAMLNRINELAEAAGGKQ